MYNGVGVILLKFFFIVKLKLCVSKINLSELNSVKPTKRIHLPTT